MKYIQGEKFKSIGDNNKIFYCDTHNVNDFFDSIKFDHDFILVSHNSDGKVTKTPKETDADFNKKPKNLKKWFAQNVCVEDEIMVSLPIGLENSEWFPNINKIGQMINKLNSEKYFKNTLYVNHNINTNIKERELPYKLFSNKDYVTCVSGHNGLDYENYIDNIYNHKFVLCPEGNGTDTHRTWECLYMDTIPIEKRNINNSFYDDLPICFVDKWDDITEEFLNEEYNRITKIKYNLSKIDFNYWVDEIKKLQNEIIFCT